MKKKFTKLLIKIVLCLTLLLFVIITALHFALVYLLPTDNVKNKILSTLQEQLATEVKIESISASLADFAINNLEIKINNKDFINITRAYLHFSLKALIFGKIRVNSITISNLTAYIEKNKDGKFNFEELLAAPMFTPKDKEDKEKQSKEEQEKEDLINLLLHRAQLNNISIYYNDEKENINVKLTDTYVSIDDFGFDEPFKLTLYSKVDTFANNINFAPTHLSSVMFIKLNPNELDKATINIDRIKTKYKDFVLSIKGDITNLKKPNAILDISLTNLSSQILEGICETPNFNIPSANIKTNFTTDIDNDRIDVSFLNLNLMDSTIDANGYFNYSKMNYNFDVIINLLLDKLQSVMELIEEYKPSGQIKSKLSVSNKEIKGNLVLENVCAFTPQLGDFTNINSAVDINGINEIKIPNLTGELNKYPFNANVSYLLTENHGDIVINFKADKFIGKASKVVKKENTNVSSTKETKTEKKSNPLPPFTVKANCNINFLDIPFLRANKVLFDADLSNVTTDLNNIKGYLKLDSSNGLIKDIYKLTEANALTKGLFLSLKIISDVINTLNVLDLLSSIGSVFSSKDDATKENEAIVEHQKIDGQIEFDSFLTKLNFSQGKADFDKCSFVSNLLSFRVTGNMNFKENLIGMTVFTAPGEHEVDGIMPLTMKINGTMDNPKGSLSLLGSVSSLVGDMLTKNVVADKLKKGFSALFGLKKNDEQGNEIKEDEDTSNSTEDMFDD